MEFANLDYAVVDRVAEITMRREPVNAINHALIEDINNAYRKAKADPGVHAVILTSAFERSFSAGIDLAMIRNARGLDLRRYLEKLYFEMHDLQYRLGKPTIAALTGPARAAGVTLAVSCDVLIASDTASLGYPEILVGVIPAMHFVHLPRQIGRHKAFELLFSGRPVSAEDACAMGLVNKVVPAHQVKDGRPHGPRLRRQVAAGHAARPRLFMRANDFEYRRAIENVVETICNIIETDDAQEGSNAFNEKRPPTGEP